MKKKFIWVVVSGLVVVALLLAACAPAPTTSTTPVTPVTPVTPATPTAPAVKETAPTTPATPAPPAAEVPKYGGVLRLALRSRVLNIDQAGGQGNSADFYNRVIGNTGFVQSWAMGPSGTGETDLLASTNILDPVTTVPSLFESWELPDPSTIIIHIRQGVRFHNKPPVNGRELDATDVVRTNMRNFYDVPGSYLNRSFEAARKPLAMKALDKYTVEVKITPGMEGEVLRVIGDYVMVEPREIYDLYGGQKNWTHLIGSGAFMIQDHVEESSTTFVRNPNYWETDPSAAGKGNQLPYVDGLVMYCIPDVSTRIAALRTGKIDQLEWLTQEQLQGLTGNAPQLESRKILSAGLANGLSMRNDTQPFNDVRVRQALSMAIDREAIARDLYQGDANFFISPVTPYKVHLGKAYMPLAELPPEARQMYEYHPDLSKKLLADAGYPNGFKTEAMAYAPEQVDMLTIIKGYFAKIGVDLTIDVREVGIYTSVTTARQHKAMVSMGLSSGNPFRFHPYRSIAFGASNRSIVADPIVDKTYLLCETPVTAAQWEERSAMIKAIVPYMVEQAFYIELPSPLEYITWWPWLKNYSGELGTSVHRDQGAWARYIWIDQALKKSMGK